MEFGHRLLKHPFALVLPALICVALLAGLVVAEARPASPGVDRKPLPVWEPEDDTDSMHEMAMLYPSAMECAACHEQQAREWSVSPHAYTMVSPVFNAMTGFVGQHTRGTAGDFCVRCHSPAGMALEENIFMDSSQRAQVSREGITCIGCHRVNRNYGRISGRKHIVPGDVFAAVYGPGDGSELERVQQLPAFQLATPETQRGMPVHLTTERFFEMGTPAFCGSCHEFLNHPGMRNQETLSEYRHSPSARQGITCQDCHMGVEPGAYSGNDSTNYAWGPAAVVNGNPTATRRLTNHMMVGPDHSLIHPGIFPLSPRAHALAEVDDWVSFDWKSGWGTPEFEDSIPRDFPFPPAWENYDDRLDAGEIIEDNLELLNEYMGQRLTLLRNGYGIGDIRVRRAGPRHGIQIEVPVLNVTDGHSVPTGFSVRPLYLRVTVSDTEGTIIYQSGDLDPNGGFRDRHSLFVQHGELPLDGDLFNLQPRFIVRNMFGGEREVVVPINFSPSPTQFMRPFPMSYTLAGRPLGVRIQRNSIRPGDQRRARYSVGRDQLTGLGPYTVNVKLIAPMIPASLISTIMEMGFEYGMTPRQLAQRVVSGHTTIWEYEAAIDADAGSTQANWVIKDAVPFRFQDLD